MEFIKIKEYLDSLYSPSLKASYDNVGLMVGSLKKEVNTILLALDLTREVMDEAIKKNVDLIITHHPLLFKPLYMIDTDSDPGSIIKDLIKYDIVNFSLHTNFDSAKMNDYLSSLIGIENKEVLSIKENCGVIGTIKKTSLKDYVKVIKDAFKIDECEYYGEKNLSIEKVAICGGSGSSFFMDALNKGADLYITGDVSYSRGIEAKRMGLNVLNVGHFIESLYVNVLKKDLSKLDKSFEIIKSKVNPVPYIKF